MRTLEERTSRFPLVLSVEGGPEAGNASLRKTGVFRTLRSEGGITLKIEDIPVRKHLSDWVITSEVIRQGFPTPFKTSYARNRDVSLLRAGQGWPQSHPHQFCSNYNYL